MAQLLALTHGLLLLGGVGLTLAVTVAIVAHVLYLAALLRYS